MITRTLTRRLERLGAYLAPPDDKPALVIHLTGVGRPDQIIKVRETGGPDLRRRPWPTRRVTRAGEYWKLPLLSIHGQANDARDTFLGSGCKTSKLDSPPSDSMA